MDLSNHTRLYTDPRHIAVAHRGIVGSIIQSFEALNRQRWSAPWDDDCKERTVRR